MIGTSCCQKFPFWDFSLCRSKKYSHEPRSPEKTKGTNEAKDYNRFPIVVPKTDSGEPNVVSRQCLYQKPEEPSNLRTAKKFDCAKPNEALKVAEKAPRTSLLMKTNPNTGQGKKPQPRAEKVLRF